MSNHNADFSQTAEEESLLSYIHQVLAKKYFILIVVAFFGCVGAFLAQIPDDRYSASALVQIEERSENLGLPMELIGELLSGEPNSTLDAEFHVIKSRLVLDQVVKDQNLNFNIEPVEPPVIGRAMRKMHSSISSLGVSDYFSQLYPARYPLEGDDIEIADFFAAESAVGRSFLIEILDNNSFYISLAQDEMGERVLGYVGEKVVLNDYLSLRIQALSSHPGAEFELNVLPIRVASARLAQNLSISERGGKSGTGIVDFSVSSTEPLTAVSVVNAVVAAYQKQAIDRRTAEIDQSIEFIERQLPDARQATTIALNQLREYSEQEETFTNLSVITQEALSRLVELEARLEELNFQKSQLSLRVTNNHPEFLRIEDEVKDVSMRLEALREEFSNIPEKERRLAQLTKNVSSSQQIEEQLMSRLEQLKIVKASTVGVIRVLEPSEVAVKSGPSRTRPILFAAIFGGFMAIAWVLLQNSVSDGIEDASEVESLGLSVFSTIPMVEHLKKASASDKVYKIVVSEPDGLVSEAFRGLRTGLKFSLALENTKAITITSSAPNEGKSFTALNLAIISALAKSKVLLVDADMRRGELHKAFGGRRKVPGLSSYLSGQHAISEIIQEDEETGVHYILNGGYPPNPSELLSSDRLKKLLDEVKADFDIIIFDCPPVLAVTDAVIVASEVKTTFLVVSHLRTSKPDILSSKKILSSSGVEVNGVIVNGYDQKGTKYGSYSMKYGYYQAAYKYRY